MAGRKLKLTREENAHIALMRAVLENVNTTPLVLKGGTALMIAYGLDRFSNDLDFDSNVAINLATRIPRQLPDGTTISDVVQTKDTSTVSRYRVSYSQNEMPGKLKIEVSYRDYPTPSDINMYKTLKVASIERLIHQKLQAAFDGKNPRTKIRDLYDLYFVSKHCRSNFNRDLVNRLSAYSRTPDDLLDRYNASYQEDDIVNRIISLEDLILEINESSIQLEKQYPPLINETVHPTPKP